MAAESQQCEEFSKKNEGGDGCDCNGNGECGRSYHWIQKINHSNQDLTVLPSLNTDRFRFCIKIDLSNNKLTGSVNWLLTLKRLEWVDLSHNELTSLPPVCPSSLSIKYLDISCNLFTALPEWILHLKEVRFLSLKNNPMSESFALLLRKAHWESIEHCHLGNINITVFPNCLQVSPKLVSLFFGNQEVEDRLGKRERNSLWSLPDQLPPSLTVFNLRSLYLNNFDCAWKTLIKLEDLDASLNQIRWLPEDFTSLTRMKYCNLSTNRIHALPDDFGALKNLRHLNLSNNFIGVLPRSLEQLENLVHLDLYANDIEVIDCDLSLLSKLEEVDLWMNRVDPADHLKNHESLCARLRNGMPKETRVSDKLPPQSDSCLTVSPTRSYITVASSVGEGDPADDTVPSDLQEETWDTEGFTDDEEESRPRCRLPNCEWSPIRDEHYFRPSDLHAPSYVKPPFHFGPSVPGQFDDAD